MESSTELWDRLELALFRQVIEVFANAGIGVRITPDPTEDEVERSESV